MIPEPYDVYSLFRNEAAAILIVPPRVDRIVLTAIQFNRELCLVTIEIKNVAANRMLAAKLVVAEAPVA
jgi:hypothetical protein